MKKVSLLVIGLIFVLICPAMATLSFEVPSLGSILENPTLKDIVHSGSSYVSLNTDASSSTISLSIENAGFARSNKLGIFDYSDPTEMLELFKGEDDSGDSVIVTFDISNGQAWVKPWEKAAIGPKFGLYLDSTATSYLGGGFFYSDPYLNTGSDYGVTRALLFDTHDIPDIAGNPDIVVAFEDLRFDSIHYPYDGDFNDMVVGFSMVTVTPVPEPTTLALLGMGCLVFVRKKFYKT